ncbi:arylsulfatase [Streptomyces sp. CB03911]|uniref:arylsulfatase n=1 Tax=Streptomyces sp. CB03911 TaxID=1804758 RepID=UPI000938CDFD|nr:arylsulfatase [Streptomyces sp. CB03911]OKI13381.1 arylsulfatase [Streptomyces sp. CB03911]
MADVQRQILPVPDLPRPGPVTYDAKDPDTAFPPIEVLLPPEGAPNVLVIMLDDVGFGAPSTFGGPCETPVFDRLAAGGLRFTRFHTTALCSPSRQALLTGRNHHSVGMGGITEMATSAPGYSSVRPNTKAPVAEILRLNGYSTAQFGKCHEVPVWQTGPAGPFDAWPSGGGGFEHFYGFIGGETNQYSPSLFDGTTPVEPSKTPEEGYHLTEDLTDRAIAWVRQQKTLMTGKPFFCYFAPGATHAPHHVPKEWADRYRGRFDQGWDAIREQTLARQKELGVVPRDAELTVRHEEIPAWEEVEPELRPVLARQMEVYAGFLTHTDHHVGRLIDAIEDLGVLDDTLVYVITGDNGASGEGGLRGTFNEMLVFNALSEVETPQYLTERIDKFGTPEAYNHYAVGWAHAMDTPYQWTKQVASHWGGTRNGTIVHWPRGITAAGGGARHQFSHVIDVAPTILEAAGIPEPTMVNGVQQSLMEGTSMLYAFNDADAPERHDHQYFEMLGNRGIYHRGWSAVTKHRTPWVLGPGQNLSFDDDVWELYDGATDWTQAHDLAAQMPDKLRHLQRLWLIEAARYNVLPMDDRVLERMNSDLAGRPELVTGRSQVLYQGMGRLTENSLINVKNKSFSVTAKVTCADEPVTGVILCQGGRFGGWSLYTRQGRARFAYNLCGLDLTVVEADRPIPAGGHQVRMDFTYDGGGLGKGGTVTLSYDGAQVGEGRVERTLAFLFSADETADVGQDAGTPVAPDYDSPNGAFTGDIHWVQIDTEPEDPGHLIQPEERIRIAMARQ